MLQVTFQGRGKSNREVSNNIRNDAIREGTQLPFLM